MLAEVDPKRPVAGGCAGAGQHQHQVRRLHQAPDEAGWSSSKMEEKKIPENINYDEIQSLRIEA